jgi:hypothetical protein
MFSKAFGRQLKETVDFFAKTKEGSPAWKKYERGLNRWKKRILKDSKNNK